MLGESVLSWDCIFNNERFCEVMRDLIKPGVVIRLQSGEIAVVICEHKAEQRGNSLDALLGTFYSVLVGGQQRRISGMEIVEIFNEEYE
jgi:hypothetical protein